MSLTFLEFVVLSLASFRATQLVTRDSIGDPLRERFILWAENSHWPKVADLAECGWCAGFWLSGLTLLTFLLAVDRWGEGGAAILVHVIEWFAIAGAAGALFQIIVTSKEQAEAAGAIADDEDEDG